MLIENTHLQQLYKGACMLTQILKWILLGSLSVSGLVACGETGTSTDLPVPEITSVDPDKGEPGTVVTVKGNNFGNNSSQISLSFNGQVGSIVGVETGQVQVKVPTLATGTYELGATLGGRKSRNTKTFTIFNPADGVTNQPDIGTEATPPKITISSPKPGEAVNSSIVNIIGGAADVDGISAIEYTVDNGPVVSLTTSLVSFQLSFWEPGEHMVKLIARDGKLMESSLSIKFSVAPKVKDITVGPTHALALTTEGRVWEWGLYQDNSNSNGKVNEYIPYPRLVPGVTKAVSMAAGAFHSLVADADGNVWQWGSSCYGNTYLREPSKIQGLSGIFSVADGAGICLALKSDGSVWGWGAALPCNGLCDRSIPERLNGFDGAQQISTKTSVLVLKKDGTVWAFGDGRSYGPLGTDSLAIWDSISRVQGLNDIIQISQGESHSLALKADGTVWGWGKNEKYQIGDGTTITRYRPIQIPGLSNIKSVEAGFEYSMAVGKDGSVYRWGVTAPYTEIDPVKTPTRLFMPEPIAQVSSFSHSIAVVDSGNLYAWGSNNAGQLVDRTTTTRFVPAEFIPRKTDDSRIPPDTEAPTISVMNDICIAGNYLPISFSDIYVSPGNSTRYTVAIDGGVDSVTGVINCEPLGEGLHSAKVTARDSAGNSATRTFQFTKSSTQFPVGSMYYQSLQNNGAGTISKGIGQSNSDTSSGVVGASFGYLQISIPKNLTAAKIKSVFLRLTREVPDLTNTDGFDLGNIIVNLEPPKNPPSTAPTTNYLEIISGTNTRALDITQAIQDVITIAGVNGGNVGTSSYSPASGGTARLKFSIPNAPTTGPRAKFVRYFDANDPNPDFRPLTTYEFNP
jgi:alpha-tubulin suppressor-like RCC1 family protein